MEKEEFLTQIAREQCGVGTLETRHSDGLDFHEVSVWSLKVALEKAYDAGAEHAMEQKIAPALLVLQRRMTALADDIAVECRRQLPYTGRAKLCLEELAHSHNLDFHGNQALWDIAAEAIAEELGEQELDMEMDDGALIFTHCDLHPLIAVCEKQILFDPSIAPSDQQWNFTAFNSSGELTAHIESGNWAARTAFAYRNLCFVQQIGGGDEWLALKRDSEGWHSFDSISLGHIIAEHGAEHCQNYIESMASTPTQDQIPQPELRQEPGMTLTM